MCIWLVEECVAAGCSIKNLVNPASEEGVKTFHDYDLDMDMDDVAK